MKKELTTLADELRQIAFEAGCALLLPTQPHAVAGYARRYNRAFRRLRELRPIVGVNGAFLTAQASPGSIRIAARDAASLAQASLCEEGVHMLAA